MRRLCWSAGLLAVVLGMVTFAAAQEEPALEITGSALGTGVQDRVLVGVSDTFREGDQVWYWTRVAGGRDGDRIRHVWLKDGREMVSVGLTLGGPHWRTWTRKILYPGSAGSWTVEARDASGRVLASASFTCLPPGD